MVIDQEKIKNILSVLKNHGDDSLMKEFRAIVAMARNRQQARNEIDAQSIPIFLHLIPYAILINRGINPPKGWKTELEAFFGSIDIKNSGKRRLWFSDTQILNMLDDLLNIQVKKQILKKAELFKGSTYYSVLVNGVASFFNENKKLEDLGIDIKHKEDESGLLSLSLSIRNKLVF